MRIRPDNTGEHIGSPLQNHKIQIHHNNNNPPAPAHVGANLRVRPQMRVCPGLRVRPEMRLCPQIRVCPQKKIKP